MTADNHPIAATAADALRLYKDAFENDGLIQGGWHEERDGRRLACMLGVLGPDISSPQACPAQIMPRWLARTALDHLMGDSDLPGDESPEMQAMKALSAAIVRGEGQP